ncbi:MAG: M28 family peptidase [Phycisphaeraceae bacterium]|nr:M28 family peptidase [Phycisphaeraceae bacterium]
MEHGVRDGGRALNGALPRLRRWCSVVVLGAPLFGPPLVAASLLEPPDAASDRARGQGERERRHAMISPESLRAFHELFGSEPHVAGTPGDARQIERLRVAFEEMGLAARVEPFWALLPQPIDAKLEIVATAPDDQRPTSGPSAPGAPDVDAPRARRGVVALPLQEANLLDDPATAHPDLTWGWNAYSGSGEVTSGVVFAHLGREEDFARLRELGIDPAGKIALIRYGGLFRGLKVRNAEKAGAAAVLLYSDPADASRSRGAALPEDGWGDDLCIQRGSVLSLHQPGDPLTPFGPATRDAQRQSLDEVDLPRIPVQPIGAAAATEIIARMRGAEIAIGDPWQGGIPAPYRFEGGDELRLRLRVEQDREIRESANVIGVLPGSRWPEQVVIVGCHHDAWGFGAADPLAGTIVQMETARILAERARQGERPLRTVLFAAWGAEEFGIIGSVEWVEAHREAIAQYGVAYLNLDMAAMGLNLAASASPALLAVVSDATEVKRVGDPGGGSDHVGFIHHLAVPVIGLSAHGAPADMYHSNYDTVEWYRRAVGDDYASAALVTRATLDLVERLAYQPLLPMRAGQIGHRVSAWASALLERVGDDPQRAALGAILHRGEALVTLAAPSDRWLDAQRALGDAHGLDPQLTDEVNTLLMALERAWFDPAGLPGRPWTRNLALATDRSSGYRSEPLPLMAEAIRTGDSQALADAVERTADALDRIAVILQELDGVIEDARPSPRP